MSDLKEIKKPIGDFIIENATGVQGQDGVYYHYSEVCKLLNLFNSKLEKAFNDGQLSVDNVDEHGFNADMTFDEWYSQNILKKYLVD